MEWQPIETAPKDGTHIIAWDVAIQDVTLALYMEGPEGWGNWVHYGDLLGTAELSHWMPLPPPPTGAARDEAYEVKPAVGAEQKTDALIEG
ncbi:DUF551 domain-containing protein [Terrihabitans sp. B22-R8]|uniref:DUF551 domain-containing protein n=1 Tax=Terrihabitans sp. B22-R8 TaxID=3425128 RepID=UPI00403C7EDD